MYFTPFERKKKGKKMYAFLTSSFIIFHVFGASLFLFYSKQVEKPPSLFVFSSLFRRGKNFPSFCFHSFVCALAWMPFFPFIHGISPLHWVFPRSTPVLLFPRIQKVVEPILQQRFSLSCSFCSKVETWYWKRLKKEHSPCRWRNTFQYIHSSVLCKLSLNLNS